VPGNDESDLGRIRFFYRIFYRISRNEAIQRVIGGHG